MASRRMRLKGVANISVPGRGSGAKSGRPLTPAPSPGLPPSETSNPPPSSPHSPRKHFQNLASPSTPSSSDYGRTRHASSPRRPEPSPSPSYAPWSPATTQMTNRSISPTKSITRSGSRPVESPHSPYFQPIRSESPVTHSEEIIRHPPSDESNGNSQEEPRFSFNLHENEGADSRGIEAVMTNLEKEIGIANIANINSQETLRQRLQKGPGFTTSKYAELRKTFLTEHHSQMEKPPDKDKLTILHFTFWNPPKKKGSVDENSKEKESKDNKEGPSKQIQFDETFSRSEKSTKNEVTSKEQEADSGNRFKKKDAPRVKVGPNGEIIVDEQSLVIETSDSKRAKKQLEEMETVSGTNFEVGSSGLYRHKKNSSRGRDWTLSETVRFYRALSSCGTDFSMMNQFFPKRSRHELKAKFKREDRKNPGQISQALSCQSFNPDDWISSDDETQKEKEKIAGFDDKNSRQKQKPLAENRQLDENSIFRSLKTTPYPPQKSKESEIVSDGMCRPQRGRPPRLFPTIKPSREAEAIARSIVIDINAKLKDQNRNRSKSTSKPKLSTNMVEVEKKPRKRAQPRRPSKSKSKKGKGQDEEKDIIDTTPEILRFDPDDPLGYKIVGTSESESESEPPGVPRATVILDAPNCETNPHQIFELGAVTSNKDNHDHSSHNSPLQKKKRSSRMYKNRVPGPGDVPSVSQPLVDEIEIEISCQ